MQAIEVQAIFPPGNVVVSPGFMKKVHPDYAISALKLHLMGEWGIIDREDWELNDLAIKDGRRIMSVYPLPDDAGDFWIITEADRSVTTMLLPSEY